MAALAVMITHTEHAVGSAMELAQEAATCVSVALISRSTLLEL